MRHHARLGMGEETCGTWCKGDGGIRVGGISCTKPLPAAGEKFGGTWCKEDGGIRASGFSCTNSAPATSEETRGTWCKVNGGTRASGISCTKLPRRPARHAAPPPVHTEVYKLPHDNKSVLKGNFFCGIILSPERNQRCNTGNNMKGDAI